MSDTARWPVYAYVIEYPEVTPYESFEHLWKSSEPDWMDPMLVFDADGIFYTTWIDRDLGFDSKGGVLPRLDPSAYRFQSIRRDPNLIAYIVNKSINFFRYGEGRAVYVDENLSMSAILDVLNQTLPALSSLNRRRSKKQFRTMFSETQTRFAFRGGEFHMGGTIVEYPLIAVDVDRSTHLCHTDADVVRLYESRPILAAFDAQGRRYSSTDTGGSRTISCLGVDYFSFWRVSGGVCS